MKRQHLPMLGAWAQAARYVSKISEGRTACARVPPTVTPTVLAIVRWPVSWLAGRCAAGLPGPSWDQWTERPLLAVRNCGAAAASTKASPHLQLAPMVLGTSAWHRWRDHPIGAIAVANGVRATATAASAILSTLERGIRGRTLDELQRPAKIALQRSQHPYIVNIAKNK